MTLEEQRAAIVRQFQGMLAMPYYLEVERIVAFVFPIAEDRSYGRLTPAQSATLNSAWHAERVLVGAVRTVHA